MSFVERSLVLICVSLIVVLGITQSNASDRWPAFQGGAVRGKIAEAPLTWSPKRSVRWRVKLAGYGQSSPVVWDGRVFVTSLSGDMKQDLHLQAFELGSGKMVWQHDQKNSSPEKNTNYVSRAAPSPVCDEEGVIALFEGGNLVALSHDGKIRWQRDFVKDYGAIKARHGLASSLEQNETHVFVWIEQSDDPYVLAISKSNGKTVWKGAGLGVTTWSSPRLIPVGDAHHLVLSGIGKLAGLDPATGKRLWDFSDISGNSTPTPIPLGSGRFLIGASVGRGETGGGSAAASNGVIQIDKLGDGRFEAMYAWRAKKATSSFGSPIAHQGHAYFINRSGVVYCLDLKTGEEKYARRTAESTWATPIATGDRIYLFGRSGTTTVIKSGPEFDQLGENKLWENDDPKTAAPAGPPGMSFGGPVLYAVVAVDSQLILRRGDTLYAVANED
jgi:outer membrane protein assembly factor BamB